jgi:hypothetical protein
MTRGVSSHYEREGEPIPEDVATCIDKMKANVARAPNAREKCVAYEVHLWTLGNVTGEAAWQGGFDAGSRFFNTPSEGHIRIELTVGDLMQVLRLADVGFGKLICDKESAIAFKDQKNAEAATQAIERLEFYTPKELRNPGDPYAHSFNRQAMIWRRWPSEKQTP